MRKIGDKIWVASMENYQESITCLECFGKKELTVILGDDSKVVIPCAGCSRGFEPPTGYMQHYQYKSKVEERIITGIEMRIEKEIDYITDRNIWCESKVFDTKEEAEKRSLELVEQHNKEEKDRIYKKKTDSHSWAWHVHYYRREIRNAEKTIKFATERLGIAKIKAKEKNKEEIANGN